MRVLGVAAVAFGLMSSSALAATVAYEATTLAGPGVGGIEPVSGNGASPSGLAEISVENPAYASEPAGAEWVWVDLPGVANDAEDVNSAVFSYSFDLSGFIAETAVLTLDWAVDNFGTVELNGNVISTLPNVPGNFTSLTPVSEDTDSVFNDGSNELVFNLEDNTGPAGFIADVTITASPIPVPGALPLALGGIAAFGALRVMRRQS
jgi:hypothetical protein